MTSLSQRLRLLADSRLLRGVAANSWAQIAIAILQLVAVPIYILKWGAAAYGDWLIISTLPASLGLLDFGFASAAGNTMTAQVAIGDREGAAGTLHSAAMVVAGIAIFWLVGGVCVAVGLPDAAIAGLRNHFDEAPRSVLVALIVYGLVAIQGNVQYAAFRAIGEYALGTTLISSIGLFENLAAVAGLFMGAGFGAVAAILLISRLVGVVLLVIILRLRAPPVFYARWRGSLAVARSILGPALALLPLPVAQAILLQGTVLVLGAANGAASVPAFTVARTLSRVGLQLVQIVNHAIMPEFTMAHATDLQRRKAELFVLNLMPSVLILLPGALLTIFFGRDVIAYWTHGAIHPSLVLLLLLSAGVITNGIWWPTANLLLAINHHSQFSYLYVALSALVIAVAYPVARLFGADGVAGMLLVLDVTMGAWVLMRFFALRLVDHSLVRDVVNAAVRLGGPQKRP